MNGTALAYEIQTVDDPEGGLRLELVVEGQCVAAATAGKDELALMKQ